MPKKKEKNVNLVDDLGYVADVTLFPGNSCFVFVASLGKSGAPFLDLAFAGLRFQFFSVTWSLLIPCGVEVGW